MVTSRDFPAVTTFALGALRVILRVVIMKSKALVGFLVFLLLHLPVSAQEQKKQHWTDRHPKIYHALKKVRTFCVFVSPGVQVVSGVVTAVAVVFK